MIRHPRPTFLLLLLAILLVPHAATAQRGGGPPQAQPVAPLRFQYMGPESAGRIASVAGVPGDPNVYYAGAASGGVWKTTDGGKTFEPVFDDQPAQAIGALAVSPSSPNIVWAGTGEAWTIRPSDVMGDGIYKSTDAGKSWKHAGLRETGRIARILVHPSNPQVAYVCALGRTTGPQQERGVFKTIDGGVTWTRSLFVDPNTGCSGIAMDVKNPDVLLAGTWEVKMQTHLFESGGPGSGVYLTRDGGAKWTKVVTGMPKPPVGKIDVAIAPADSSRMYALIQTANQGSLWRSDDAGVTWRVVSWDRTLIGRAGYYINVKVNPANADDVMVANSSFHRSTDGGLTFPGSGGCGDCHDIWIDPTDGKRYALTDDGGMSITTNNGQNYTQVRLPIGQMYHVAIDNRAPYWIYSNRQDNGTMRGPSTTPMAVTNVPSYSPAPPAGGGRGGFGGGGGRGAGALQWEPGIGGCESGFTMPVPNNPDVIWATCYGSEVTRYDARTRRARSVGPWIHTLDSEPTKTKYRCHWTPPLAFDPFEPETVYYGCQVIFRTSDRGETWDVISPDLSTKDPSRIVFSGGVVGDNLGQFYGALVYAIAPSKVQRGLLWAGTNDGKIWNTRDGGKTWNDLTKNVAGIAPWGTIAKIEPSVFHAGTAYVVVDYHIMDDRDPHVYTTTDFGANWTKISGGLPHGHPLAYALSLAENPNRQGMLFVGTGNGFYYTVDDGRTWAPFREGLPAAPVTWIEVQKRAHDVVISTYGRGLYILRDITRLEQQDRRTSTTAAYFYAPRSGVREARGGSAEFVYALPDGATGDVRFEIQDAAGQSLRTISVPARPGLNRVTWDLRGEGPRQIALRTIPPDNPHIWEEARFKGRDTRPIIHWGIQNPQRSGALMAPGKYSVRMTAGGQTQTRELEIEKDPSIPSSSEDIAENTGVQRRMVDDLNQTVDLVNRLEVIRKQIEDQAKVPKGNSAVAKALADLDARALDVELQLLSRTELHSDDKWYVEQYKVYLNLVWHYGVIGTGAGDVQGGADYRPTRAHLEVLKEIEAALAKAKSDFDALVQKEIPAFNKAMAGKLAPIGVGGTD